MLRKTLHPAFGLHLDLTISVGDAQARKESIGFHAIVANASPEMVLYFTPIGTDVDKDDWKIFMGRDKFENEDLIKYGLPHDVW